MLSQALAVAPEIVRLVDCEAFLCFICLTCVKVVLCLLLAGVGQVEDGLWEGLCTDMEPDSPSVFSFLNAPSKLKNCIFGME